MTERKKKEKRTNEWINERTKVRMNISTNKQMKEGQKKRKKEYFLHVLLIF